MAEKFVGAVDEMNHHKLTQFHIEVTADVEAITGSNGIDLLARDNTCKGEKVFLLQAFCNSG